MPSVIKFLVVSSDPELHVITKQFSLSTGSNAVCVPSSQEAMALLREGIIVNYVLFDATRITSYGVLDVTLIEWIGTNRLCVLLDRNEKSARSDAITRGVNKVLRKPLYQDDLQRLAAELMTDITSPACPEQQPSRVSTECHL